MHRSSESVAALATALAKAQGELVNPEKSLIATIQAERRGEFSRTFRYASLSSGLDIVRKTLGRHEIAIMQTTAIDQATSAVNLTTVLAHASGEWIASDWPVCQLSDTATPRRMGAALTYARRYALFTLVGIAGEDDVDAPDLNDDAGSTLKSSGIFPKPNGATKPIATAHVRRPIAHRPREPLKAEKSAALRDQLLSELAGLTTTADGTIWAQKILKAKNSLTHEDAQLVEKAFESKFAGISAANAGNGPEPKPSRLSKTSNSGQKRGASTQSIDKSKLRFGEPRRYRNKAHLRFVASQCCLICGRQPSDAHHLRFAQPQALGRKVSDEFTVPLCRTHHREVHHFGDESAWWEGTKIEPQKVARDLWRQTRLNIGPETISKT